MHPVMTHLALHVQDLEACITFYREFCGMQVVHERSDGEGRVVWLAEPGREQEFIFVMVPGGTKRDQAATDYSHFGFALDSRAAVDAIAEKARLAGYLAWEPREEPYPVGYYCGVRDPDGNMVEFSYGQPLGPGTPRSTGTPTARPSG
jgi:catechol 2,3-dioxygenase-like lactoylglutathione lyase family enzyme